MSRLTISIGVLALTATAATAQEMTIEGRVYRGVEMNCYLIDDIHTGVSFLLSGGGPDLRHEGITASVTGIPRPDWVSYCMQGIPFEIVDYTVLYPWFWPPPNCEITPEAPTFMDPVTIMLSGIWPNSCKPQGAAAEVKDGTVFVDVAYDYPPGIACLAMLTPWSVSVTLDPLDPGPYQVMASLDGHPLIDPKPAPVCSFVVTREDCERTPIDVFPPNCAIDARQPCEPDGSNRSGWDEVTITFDGPASCLSKQDFAVFVRGGLAAVPFIDALIPDGDTLTLTLTTPIPVYRWLCIRYKPTDDVFCWAHQPADVNGDGVSVPCDILRVIDCLNGRAFCETWQCDVDRSGECGPPDILRVIDLMNGAGEYPWLWPFPGLCRCPSEP